MGGGGFLFQAKNYFKEEGKDEIPAVRLVENCSAVYKVHQCLLIKTKSVKSDSSLSALETEFLQ